MSGTVRVVVAGAAGRMGTLAAAAIDSAEDLVLAGTLVRGDDPGAVLAHAAAQVLVDVSVASASRILVPLAARAGLAPIVGTSGLDDDDLRHFAQACDDGGVGGLVVPNFSIGAVLQMRAAVEAAGHLHCSGIHEVHHPAKRDSPSGTARATAARIASAAGQAPPITSERRAGVLALQTVSFGNAFERLELHHEVSDRRAYVPGLLLAVRRVGTLEGLALGLEAILSWPREERSDHGP